SDTSPSVRFLSACILIDYAPTNRFTSLPTRPSPFRLSFHASRLPSLAVFVQSLEPMPCTPQWRTHFEDELRSCGTPRAPFEVFHRRVREPARQLRQRPGPLSLLDWRPCSAPTLRRSTRVYVLQFRQSRSARYL